MAVKADLLALQSSQNDAMVALINQIVDPTAPVADPLAGEIAAVQADIKVLEADAAKIDADVNPTPAAS